MSTTIKGIKEMKVQSSQVEGEVVGEIIGNKE
jgi:hypothetical protein